MTNEQLAVLLALPAGRELDAEVQRIMGDEVEWRACHWYPDSDFWNETQSIDEAQGVEVYVSVDHGSMQPCHHGPYHADTYPDWEVVQEFSTSWAAAEPLLDEMLAAGVSVTMRVVEGQLQLLWQWHEDVMGISLAAQCWGSLYVPTLADKPLAVVRAWLTWKLGKEQAT